MERGTASAAVISGAAFGGVFALAAAALTGFNSFAPPLAAFLLSGVGFGGALYGFARVASRSTVLEPGGLGPGFEADEVAHRHGLANHFKGFEGVGGKLFLTNRRLRFRSHAMNVQVHDESYPLETIAKVEATRTLGLIPNGLRVTLCDGRVERFIVHGNAAWVTAIEQAGSAYR